MDNGNKIDRLDIDVTVDDKSAQQNVDSLSKSLHTLNDSIKDIGKSKAFNLIESQIQKAETSASKLNDVIRHAGRQTKDIGKGFLSDAQEKIKETESNFGRFSGRLSYIWGTVKDKLGFTDLVTGAKDYFNVLKSFYSTKALQPPKQGWNTEQVWNGDTLGTFAESASRATVNWSSLLGVVKSVASRIGSGVWRAFSATISKIGSGMNRLAKSAWRFAMAPVSALGNGIKSIGSRFGKLASQFKRVALYRALRESIHLIVEGIKEGIDNAYQWASIMDNEFAGSMDSLATSALYLKNSLGAMAMPLINVVAPIVERVTDLFVGLLNTVNQLIARLSGRSTWVKAVRYPTSYGEALDDATGSAKALEKELITILGIDEINPMEGANDSGRGSGSGGASGQDYSSMFEEQVISNEVNDWAKLLEDSWKNADFTEVGSIVGGKINTALAGIPWDEYQSTATDIGKSLGTFLNGAVGTVQWEDVGGALSQGVNTVVAGLSGFVKSLEFDTLGDAFGGLINGALGALDWDEIDSTARTTADGIASSLNAFIAKTDTNELGETFSTLINTVIGMASTAIKAFKWEDAGSELTTGINTLLDKVKWKELKETAKDFGKGVASFLNSGIQNLDAPTVGQAISGTINSAISLATGFITTLGWSDLGTKVGTLLDDAIRDIKWEELGGGIHDAIDGAFEALGDAIEAIHWEDLGEDIATLIGTIDIPDILVSVSAVVEEVTYSLDEFNKGLTSGINEDFQTKMEGYYKDNQSWADLWESFVKPFKTAMEWLDENVFKPIDAWIEKITGLSLGETPDLGDNPFGYGNQELGITFRANVTGIDDNIPKSEKVISEITGEANTLKDDIPEKKIGGILAEAGSLVDGIVPSAKKIKDISAGVGSISNEIKGGGKIGDLQGGIATIAREKAMVPVLPNLTAQFSKTDPSKLSTASKTIASTANFTGLNTNWNSKITKDSSGRPMWGASANFTGLNTNWNSKIKKDNSGKPMWGASANFTGLQTNWNSKITTSGGSLMWGAKANFTGRSTNWNSKIIDSKGWLFWDALANFTGRSTNWNSKIINSNGSLFWNALANFTGRETSFDTTFSDLIAKFIDYALGFSTVTVSAKIDEFTNYPSIKAKIVAEEIVTKDGSVWSAPKAMGGAFYGGKWHDIPQYASGTLNAGSMFIAGEAGAELVGHIGGRTEVLNQSQLASTMYASVASANANQNRLLQEQNNLLRELINKQGNMRAYITSGDVVEGLTQRNRRDGRTVVAVGG